jgi:hypothetical protein
MCTTGSIQHWPEFHLMPILPYCPGPYLSQQLWACQGLGPGFLRMGQLCLHPSSGQTGHGRSQITEAGWPGLPREGKLGSTKLVLRRSESASHEENESALHHACVCIPALGARVVGCVQLLPGDLGLLIVTTEVKPSVMLRGQVSHLMGHFHL